MHFHDLEEPLQRGWRIVWHTVWKVATHLCPRCVADIDIQPAGD